MAASRMSLVSPILEPGWRRADGGKMGTLPMELGRGAEGVEVDWESDMLVDERFCCASWARNSDKVCSDACRV